jgi:predicted transcriptional regulator
MPDLDLDESGPLITRLAGPLDGIDANSQPAESAWGSISRNPKIILDILKAERDGVSQVLTATRLGISQSCVSKVVAKYSPRDDLAVLRAKALAPAMVESLKRAAINGEAKGRHGAAAAILQAAKVLGGESESGPRVLVEIGVRDSDVQVNISASLPPSDTFACSTQSLTHDIHRLTDTTVSDKRGYVNPAVSPEEP